MLVFVWEVYTHAWKDFLKGGIKSCIKSFRLKTYKTIMLRSYFLMAVEIEKVIKAWVIWISPAVAGFLLPWTPFFRCCEF